MKVTAVLLSMLGIAVVLCSVIYALIKKLNNASDENEHLKGEVAFLKKNISYVVKHQEEITAIKNEKEEVRNQLENAKNDEEVADIIAGIIAANNVSVPDKQGK